MTAKKKKDYAVNKFVPQVFHLSVIMIYEKKRKETKRTKIDDWIPVVNIFASVKPCCSYMEL